MYKLFDLNKLDISRGAGLLGFHTLRSQTTFRPNKMKLDYYAFKNGDLSQVYDNPGIYAEYKNIKIQRKPSENRLRGGWFWKVVEWTNWSCWENPCFQL